MAILGLGNSAPIVEIPPDCDLYFCEYNCRVDRKILGPFFPQLPCKPGERKAYAGAIWECVDEGECKRRCSTCPDSDKYVRVSWRFVCSEDPFKPGECYYPTPTSKPPGPTERAKTVARDLVFILVVGGLIGLVLNALIGRRPAPAAFPF